MSFLGNDTGKSRLGKNDKVSHGAGSEIPEKIPFCKWRVCFLNDLFFDILMEKFWFKIICGKWGQVR